MCAGGRFSGKVLITREIEGDRALRVYAQGSQQAVPVGPCRPLSALCRPEPEALRLRAPQRGLMAIAEQQDPASSPEYNGLPTIIQSRTGHLATVPAGIVKLLLPPRKSRGISLWGLDA
jgi:hypothetical protein